MLCATGLMLNLGAGCQSRNGKQETMMVQDTIQSKLEQDLQPIALLIENESHMHGGSREESHFNITAVSTHFDGQNLVKRHQHVYKLLAQELTEGVHALALHLYTPDEWSLRQQSAPASPDCRGGSKQ